MADAIRLEVYVSAVDLASDGRDDKITELLLQVIHKTDRKGGFNIHLKPPFFLKSANILEIIPIISRKVCYDAR